MVVCSNAVRQWREENGLDGKIIEEYDVHDSAIMSIETFPKNDFGVWLTDGKDGGAIDLLVRYAQ